MLLLLALFYRRPGVGDGGDAASRLLEVDDSSHATSAFHSSSRFVPIAQVKTAKQHQHFNLKP
jgi:hypothetical protein